MRHYLQPSPVPMLPGRVSEAAVAGQLVALARLAHPDAPPGLRARASAIAMAVVAPAAEEENLSALRPGADHEAKRIHRTPPDAPLSGVTPGPAVLPRSTRPLAAHPSEFAREAIQLSLAGLSFFGSRALGFYVSTACPQLFSLPRTPSKDLTPPGCSFTTTVLTPSTTTTN